MISRGIDLFHGVGFQGDLVFKVISSRFYDDRIRPIRSLDATGAGKQPVSESYTVAKKINSYGLNRP